MTSHSTSLNPHIPDTSQPRQPLRLQLPGSPGRATLDGGWWPRSRDIDVELAELIDRFHVTRIQLRLLVVPHDQPMGEQAMALAADPSNRSSAAEILAAYAPDEEVGEVQDHSTDDGGSWWRPEDGPLSWRRGSPH